MSETTPEPATEPAPNETTAPETVGPNGFPEKTPWRDMQPVEQAAYWRHQNKQTEAKLRTESARVRELEPAAQQIQALEEASRTEAERAAIKAREDGERAGREAERAEALSRFAPRLVGAEFRAQLAGRMSGDQVTALVDGLNVSRFLTDDGAADAEAVARFVAAIPAPSVAPEAPPRPVVRDIGGGQRIGAKPNAVASGEDAFAARHGKKTSA